MGHWNGEALREARSARRLTQEDLADAIGVERKAIMAWEAGREPELGNAVAVADFFGVPLQDLIHEPEADTPPDGRGESAPRTAAVVGSPRGPHGGG